MVHYLSKSACRITLYSALVFGCFLLSQQGSAQTTTTYTYDAKGRMIESSASNGADTNVIYDDANNITNIVGDDGSGPNSPPTCADPGNSTSQTSIYVDGLEGCTDPDGDTLTLISVTDPPGSATAQVASNNQIHFQNLYCNFYTIQRTISDGNGPSVTFDYSIAHADFDCF